MMLMGYMENFCSLFLFIDDFPHTHSLAGWLPHSIVMARIRRFDSIPKMTILFVHRNAAIEFDQSVSSVAHSFVCLISFWGEFIGERERVMPKYVECYRYRAHK